MVFSAQAQLPPLYLKRQKAIKLGGNLETVENILAAFSDECNCWGILFEVKPTHRSGIHSDGIVLVSADGSQVKLMPTY